LSELFETVSAFLGGSTLTAFLGGSAFTALLNLSFQQYSTVQTRKFQRLSAQITELYGPLHYHTSQGQALLRLAQEMTGSSLDYGMTQVEMGQSVIPLTNEYLRLTSEHNSAAMAVLQKNWHLVDPDDVDEFTRFQLDIVRGRVEFGERGLITPLEVYRRAGPVSHLRPSMIDLTRRRLEQKQAELAAHVSCRPWWWPELFSERGRPD
jgi:hypothetical protein